MKQDTQHIKPPDLARRLLLHLIREDLAEEVAGDLDEKFRATVKTKSSLRAKLGYWYEAMQYLRPFAIRKSKSATSSSLAMFENYFKIAWRNLSKQRMYSGIKIGGFALGIASCILISLFISDELSYDKYIPNQDRLFRVIGAFNDKGEVGRDVYFPAPFASSMKSDFPDIEEAGRINPVELFGAGSNEIRRAENEESTYEEGFIYADPEWLALLGIPMVHGDVRTALSEPKSIVLSRKMAEKYFPGENPVGKMMVANNDQKNQLYKVGGVMEDFPSASHIHCEFVITMRGREFWRGEQTDWGSSNYHTYVLLRSGVNQDDLVRKMTKGVIEKYILPTMLASGQVDAKEVLANAWLELQPVGDIYLKSAGIIDRLKHGDIRFVWLFGSIATFILIIACINFINLSTARSANRAKEVGLRKVVGSARSSLINQFLTESILFSLLSFAIGLVLAWLMLPYFNDLAGKSMIFPWRAWWLVPSMGLAALIIGLIAGVYPSVYLSSFRPIQVLKGNLSLGSKNTSLRSGLVIFQFTISIVLIIGTFVINKQMGYILNKELGFEKDQVLLIQGANTLGPEILPFKKELLRLPGVRSTSISGYLPVEGMKRNGNPFWREGKTKTEKAIGGQNWKVDHDYVKTLGLKIVAGRDFSFDIRSDSQAVIVNQAMVRELGLKEPIGEKITNNSEGTRVYPIIGVVEDFHFESMKHDINPVCLFIGRSDNIISVKAEGKDMASVIESVSGLWKTFSPHQSVRYSFLDDRFAMMYADVQKAGSIFTSFAVLAIVVACLGLFALSAFMTEQRKKEISIRLVLGASLRNIFQLLTRSFLLLVLISLIIAAPIAWYMMNRWLEGFVYKISIGWDVFVLAGGLALLIAALTISYQSLRAALTNPVESLKME